MGREQRKALIERVEQIRGSRVICCLTSDRMNAQGIVAKDFIPIFYSHLRTFATVKRLDVFLFTTGGDTLAAFGISRLLREFADHVGALIPEKCQSAGTLLVLGANDIFMTPAATLSPIDPSVVTPLNPRVEGPAPGQSQSFPVSVEDIAGFKDLTREEWSLDNKGRAQAFALLAQNVHPLVLGQAFRTRQQIQRLAQVLLSSHRSDAKNIKDITEQLTRKLGSHDYLISRKEASDMLGSQVTTKDPEHKLENAIWDLYSDFRDEMELGRIYDPAALLQQTVSQGGQLPVKIINRFVVIETTVATDVWEAEMLLSQAPIAPHVPVAVSVPAIQQVVVYNGWRHYE